EGHREQAGDARRPVPRAACGRSRWRVCHADALYLHFGDPHTRPPRSLPLRPTRLGIIGLGAIGGSLARQAKRAGVPTIIGWSPWANERAAAAQQGTLDDAPASAREVARAVDLLVLAAPPAANLDLLAALAPHLRAGALVTDVGSVKRSIVAKAEALGLAARFAGSHPLAGTHRHGFEASRADLFAGAVVYVTPAAGGGVEGPRGEVGGPRGAGAPTPRRAGRTGAAGGRGGLDAGGSPGRFASRGTRA